MTSQVKVYNRENYEPKKFDRVLLEGSADDARDYVEKNFPRHHDGNVPMPEVYVQHEDDSVEHYYGGKWSNPADTVEE